jgi:hypothetical protein
LNQLKLTILLTTLRSEMTVTTSSLCISAGCEGIECKDCPLDYAREGNSLLRQMINETETPVSGVHV